MLWMIEVSFVLVVPVVRDETDVGHAFAVEVPGYDVAGLVVTAVGRDRDALCPCG